MATSQLRDGPRFFKPLVDVIEPLQFKLKNSDTIATAFPIYSPDEVPLKLKETIWHEFNSEVSAGQTYPHSDEETLDAFVDYWFHSFCVIILRTDKLYIDQEEQDWDNVFLGTFYVKPNYLPRCSHNCNGGFLVNHKLRGMKIGYRLAQVYLKWAPLLGYKYSVFNLVFATNSASWKLWEFFKFDKIGVVPGAAVLNNHDKLVDAFIYGKDLTKVEPELLLDLV